MASKRSMLCRSALRWRFPLAIAMALLILVLGAATVRSDEPNREFSFTGRATIDGEPAAENTLIEIEVNGKIIGRGLVTGDDGKWVIKIDAALIQDGVCEAVFYVDGRAADRQWNRCAVDIRLEVDPSEADGSSDSDSSDELSDPEQSDDPQEPDASQESGDSQTPDPPRESDEAQEPDASVAQSEAEQSDVPEAEVTVETPDDSAELVQPSAPRTGTGGAQVDDGDTGLLRTAALVGYLALIVGVAALLLVSRSSRFSKRDNA